MANNCTTSWKSWSGIQGNLSLHPLFCNFNHVLVHCCISIRQLEDFMCKCPLYPNTSIHYFGKECLRTAVITTRRIIQESNRRKDQSVARNTQQQRITIHNSTSCKNRRLAFGSRKRLLDLPNHLGSFHVCLLKPFIRGLALQRSRSTDIDKHGGMFTVHRYGASCETVASSSQSHVLETRFRGSIQRWNKGLGRKSHNHVILRIPQVSISNHRSNPNSLNHSDITIQTRLCRSSQK